MMFLDGLGRFLTDAPYTAISDGSEDRACSTAISNSRRGQLAYRLTERGGELGWNTCAETRRLNAILCPLVARHPT